MRKFFKQILKFNVLEKKCEDINKMPGGLIQLKTYGPQNHYLNGNPQMTYFKVVYRRYTNFSMEFIRQSLKGPTELDMNNSIKLSTRIDRNGDLLSNLYFAFTLPNIFSGYDSDTNIPYNFQWIKNIGENIIDSATITIGGQKVDKIYGEWINIWAELNIENSRRPAYERMIGNVIELTNPSNVSGYFSEYPVSTLDSSLSTNPIRPTDTEYDPTDRPPSILGRNIYVPLPFWFTQNSGLALPLIALQYHDVELQLELKPLMDLYTIVETDSTNVNYLNRVKPNPLRQDQHISNFISGVKVFTNNNTSSTVNTVTSWGFDPHLDCNFIFLDKDERKKFAKSSHEYLIEQTLLSQFMGIVGSRSLKLELHHPVKQLVWVTKRNDISTRNDWNNYTNWVNSDYSPDSFVFRELSKDLPASIKEKTIPQRKTFQFFHRNILRNAKLMFNGVERFSPRPNEFFNYVQPFEYSKKGPPDGIYLYSFSIDPDKYQPSGACNMSTLKTLSLDVETNPISNTCNENENLQYDYLYDINIYSINYNILRIMGGMAGLGFAN
jgi:hypothetical protein